MSDLNAFVRSIVDRLQPLETALARAWWDAAVSGKPAAYGEVARLRCEIDTVFRDPSRFDRLADAHRSPPDDPAFARAIELLYLQALPRQIDPALGERINALATELERDFSTYRPVVRGETRSQNDLDEVLHRGRDESHRREAYEALKSVGPLLAPRLRELVGLRNEAATLVGFPDFYHLRLAVGEQTPNRLATFLDRVEKLTEEPFDDLKSEIDAFLCGWFAVPPTQLAAWHYADQFFQEMPDIHRARLDRIYGDVDILGVADRFFATIGLPVSEILDRSSLYEAEGKDPHAFATDIDREGDVRILLNLRPNERWMGTTLHELGHAVYDVGIARELEWVLRRPAHTLTTEAIAMMFGRLSRDAAWMRDMGILDDSDAERIRSSLTQKLRGGMLIAARWILVMSHFERGLYGDPDQDLNRLWWNLVERFQRISPPDRPAGAADYAAKIHITVAPVYYHNYLLGECFASQIDRKLRSEVLDGRPSYVGCPAVGEWLSEEIFRHGARRHHDELARTATGDPVGPEAFAEQFLVDVAA